MKKIQLFGYTISISKSEDEHRNYKRLYFQKCYECHLLHDENLRLLTALHHERQIVCDDCIFNYQGACCLEEHQKEICDKKDCADFIRPKRNKGNCNHVNLRPITNANVTYASDLTHICMNCGAYVQIEDTITNVTREE